MSSTKRRTKKTATWVAAAVGSAPDPRVNPDHAEYGKRRVDRLVLVDSRGRAFERVGEDGPIAPLPPPPEE